MKSAVVGALIWLASVGAAAAACDPGQQSCAAPSVQGAIHVGAATYGGTCGVAYGNATKAIAAACNGRMRCDYQIDYRRLGDPAVGCRKDFTAYWECGDGSAPRFARVPPEAGFDKLITLDCSALPPETAPADSMASAAPPPGAAAAGGDPARAAAAKACTTAVDESRARQFAECKDFAHGNCKEPGKIAVSQSTVRGGEDYYVATIEFKADGQAASARCNVDHGAIAGTTITGGGLPLGAGQ
jgi:hypothetical protein